MIEWSREECRWQDRAGWGRGSPPAPCIGKVSPLINRFFYSNNTLKIDRKCYINIMNGKLWTCTCVFR